jgi:hypothetical protein
MGRPFCENCRFNQVNLPDQKNNNCRPWDLSYCKAFLTRHNFQCCGSGMLIPDPDFYPSRISDPGSRIQKPQQKRGVKKICWHTFFCSHKFNKIENYLSFKMLKKKIWANFSKNCITFYSKICHYHALKNMGLGSGIRKKPIPDPGSRGQKGTGSGSATLIMS